jgi:hypothetical protein
VATREALADETTVWQTGGKLKLRIFVFVALILATGCASAGDLSELLQGSPESWSILDATRFNATKIVCIRDGFLDDSVRGDWHELDLRRLPDGTWRVNEARIAIRCWRTENTEVYQDKPCP